MDIKEKLKLFVDKQKQNLKASSSQHNLLEPLSPEDLDKYKSFLLIATPFRSRLDLTEQLLTDEAEQIIVNSIDPIFFKEDFSEYESEVLKFPDCTDVAVINGIRSKLRKQHNIVSRRVFHLISEKQVLCSEEMKCLMEIQREICSAANLCIESRKNLSRGRVNMTSASLGILANYAKRQRVAKVLQSLNTIQTLQMADVQLNELLKAEDYPGAIQLLLECQKATETFKHFNCISELSVKLQNTLEIAQEQLDMALSKAVVNFNPVNYEKLFVAYGLFRKHQTMMDQLHMHITSFIHNSAFTLVLGYVELYTVKEEVKSDHSNTPVFSKMQYSELCKYVKSECYLACFLDLCKASWNILKNYKMIMKWHLEQQEEGSKDLHSDDESCDKYISQKLQHGLLRIWQDVQAKVKTFILASELSNFKFEDFLKVLNVVNILIQVGEDFCGGKSESLHESIKKLSLSLFKNHHHTRMEELHMFLENEGWQICPVKLTFDMRQVVEHCFMKYQETCVQLTSPSKKSGFDVCKNFFDDLSDCSTPFDVLYDDTLEEDIMTSGLPEEGFADNDSDEDMPEELKRDYVDERTGEFPQVVPKKKNEHHQVPMVTNSSLTILRLTGKYLQMMKLLRPIAFDVMLCLCQLFEYYLYAVCSLFGGEQRKNAALNPLLRTTLARIEESIIRTEDDDDGFSDKVACPSISPTVKMDSSAPLFGLPIRVVAVESLAFLACQLEKLHVHIEDLVPSTKRIFVQQFYSNMIEVIPEVRQLIYISVASNAIDYDRILNMMMNVRWDIGELMSQHSPYIDELLRQLQILSMQLEELKKVSSLPLEAQRTFWEGVITCCSRVLLEGFASARKCTNEGRSLMQLDYQQFLMKLEGLVPLRSIPSRQLVESYIKAYYLPEGEVEKWVTQNASVYSPKHILSLVSSMNQIGKKTKQKVTLVLENAGAPKL